MYWCCGVCAILLELCPVSGNVHLCSLSCSFRFCQPVMLAVFEYNCLKYMEDTNTPHLPFPPPQHTHSIFSTPETIATLAKYCKILHEFRTKHTHTPNTKRNHFILYLLRSRIFLSPLSNFKSDNFPLEFFLIALLAYIIDLAVEMRRFVFVLSYLQHNTSS